jgi:acyl phosphate:glycerol-3-phosphate acyltransferase
MLLGVLLIGFSYLVGSLSSAIIVCRMGGYPDPRSLGSRNPGATNVLRVAGRASAALTLAGDLLKGLLPLAFGHWLDVADSTLAAMGVAAFLGHLYPVFFGFQGGKGVATFIGVLCGLAWQAGLAFMGLWLAVAGLCRYSSLAALVAAALSPVAMALVHPSPSYLLAVTAMAAVILWRHRSNIRNLLAGTERKIGARRE